METAERIAVALGDQGARQVLDKIGPQGFVVPVGSVLGCEKDLSQIH